MHQTIDLLTRALTQRPAIEWAAEFGVSQAALSLAKKRGKLSPSLAGAFAEAMAEPVEHWIAVAGLEQDTASGIRARLLKKIASGKSSLRALFKVSAKHGERRITPDRRRVQHA